MRQVYKYMRESVSHCEYILLSMKEVFEHLFRSTTDILSLKLMSSVLTNRYIIIINKVRSIRNQYY